jgi:small subunit ribosomal protein S16
MLKIRLKRVGRKGDASFRLIVTESHKSGQSNKYIDNVGFYNPQINQKDVDVEKAKNWIAKGAQVSDTAYNILVDAGAVEGKKRNVLPKKTVVAKE